MSIDSNFIILLIQYFLIALGILTVGFIVVGSIAFWRTQKGSAKTFSLFLQRANALKLLTVALIVIASTLLALTGIVDGAAAMAILSGIAGYVLGGMGRAKEEKYEDENE